MRPRPRAAPSLAHPRPMQSRPELLSCPCANGADNDITHNNLDLIRSLKEEVSDMKKKEITNEKLMFEIAQALLALTRCTARLHGDPPGALPAGKQEALGAFDARSEGGGEAAA